MKRLFSLLLVITSINAFSQTTKERIINNDPAKYREISDVHAVQEKWDLLN